MIILSGVRRQLLLVTTAIQQIMRSVIYEDMDLTPLLRIGPLNDTTLSPIQRITRTFIEMKDEKTVSSIDLILCTNPYMFRSEYGQWDRKLDR